MSYFGQFPDDPYYLTAEEERDVIEKNLRHDNAELLSALEESVALQSHYATLLNMHDGGNRIGFSSAKEWMDRLAEIDARFPSRKEA